MFYNFFHMFYMPYFFSHMFYNFVSKFYTFIKLQVEGLHTNYTLNLYFLRNNKKNSINTIKFPLKKYKI